MAFKSVDVRLAGPAIDLVAIDLDGTLLRTDKRLSKKAVNLIQTAGDKGVKVVLASARPPRSVKEIYRHLGLNTLQINYNGALIFDPPRNRNHHHSPLPAALAGRIVRLARKVDPKVAVSLEILDKWYTDFVDPALVVESSRFRQPDFIGPLESFLHVPVTKLMLLAPPHRLGRIHEKVAARFGKKIAMLMADPHLIQIVNLGVDKATALAQVALEYDVAADRVMAIGDAPNDVGMLRWAGLGVAMGNAWPGARQAADVVVPSNDEDGVSYALEKYVMGR